MQPLCESNPPFSALTTPHSWVDHPLLLFLTQGFSVLPNPSNPGKHMFDKVRISWKKARKIKEAFGALAKRAVFKIISSWNFLKFVRQKICAKNRAFFRAQTFGAHLLVFFFPLVSCFCLAQSPQDLSWKWPVSRGRRQKSTEKKARATTTMLSRLVVQTSDLHVPSAMRCHGAPQQRQAKKKVAGMQLGARALEWPTTQERKSSPKRKFSGWISRGHPGSIARISRTKTSVRILETMGKQAFWRGHPWPEGADVHDPKGFQKFRSEKFRLNFRSLLWGGRPKNRDLPFFSMSGLMSEPPVWPNGVRPIWQCSKIRAPIKIKSALPPPPKTQNTPPPP